MADKPLCFEFFGRLRVDVSGGGLRYLPVRALLARTFSAFHAPGSPATGPSLSIILGNSAPDLKNHHLVDGAYRVADGSIACSHRHKVARWEFAAAGLEDEVTTVRISGNFFSYLVFPYESIYQMILFKLAREGFAPLHALGIARDGKADLIIGRSGVGKSLLGGKFLRDGFRLLGDDTVFLDAAGSVHGFPLPLGMRSLSASLRDYGVRLTAMDRALFLLIKAIKAATMGRIALLFKLSPRRLGDRLERIARLERAVFALPAAAFTLEPERDGDAFLARVVACTGFETVLLDKLLEAYVYVFPASPLRSFRADLGRILAAGFSRGATLKAGIPPVLAESVYLDLRKALSRA